MRKDTRIAVCIKLNFQNSYILSTERIITILSPGQFSVSKGSSDPSNKRL